MAENIKTNIRQLEGALQQLSARSELMEQTIDPGTAREFLSDHIDLGTPVRLQPEDILGGVASFYGLSRDDLVDRSRRQELVRARHVAMYLCRKLTDLSFEAIGLRFAGRDHSTVVHACNRIQDALDVEDGFENELAEVQKTVRRATGFRRR
jgi:chromosomal replication initiator protein